MRCWFRSFLARAGAILVYGYGVVVAPTLHHAFHRPDHVHVGDSIVYLPETARSEADDHEHEADADDNDHDHHDSNAESEEPGHHYSDEHDEDHEQQESENALHHDSGHPSGDHSHHHHDHDDHDHGGASIWHFSAALGDHLDRTPLLGAGTVAVHLLRLERPPDYRPVTARTLRLRGPPRRKAA